MHKIKNETSEQYLFCSYWVPYWPCQFQSKSHSQSHKPYRFYCDINNFQVFNCNLHFNSWIYMYVCTPTSGKQPFALSWWESSHFPVKLTIGSDQTWKLLLQLDKVKERLDYGKHPGVCLNVTVSACFILCKCLHGSVSVLPNVLEAAATCWWRTTLE